MSGQNKNKRTLKGEKYRAMILAELLKKPLTFSQLQKKVVIDPKTQTEISAMTLTRQLKTLQKEGLLRREIRGKYIVYIAVKPETKLQLRKAFSKRFVDLLTVYGSGLNSETQNLIQPLLNSLYESIKNPEKEAETTKIFRKKISISKDFKGTISQNITNPYEETKFKKDKIEEKPKTKFCFQNKRKKNMKTPEPTSTKDPRFYGKQKKDGD